MTDEQVRENGELRIREDRPRTAGEEDGLDPGVDLEVQDVGHLPVSGGAFRLRFGAPANGGDVVEGERAHDDVSLEFANVPRAVDFEVRAELEEPSVRGHERSSRDRHDCLGTLFGLEMTREKRQAMRVPLGRGRGGQERRIVKRRLGLHDWDTYGLEISLRAPTGVYAGPRNGEAVVDAPQLYERARAAVDAGRFNDAKSAIDEAYAADQSDAPIRELYTGLHLASGVKASARARDLRRASVVRRGIGYDQEFTDTDETVRTFEEAIAEFDRVLAADPAHEKALMLKAAVLHRFDRAGRCSEAMEAVQRILAAHPENRQAKLALRKIERTCEECSDSGFCPHCGGRGSRRLLGMERRCNRCWGQGICLRCGLL